MDIRALESAGYRVEDALGGAAKKHAGLTPSQLSWVLGQIVLGEDLVPPGGISRQDLADYIESLIDRLARLAFPGK